MLCPPSQVWLLTGDYLRTYKIRVCLLGSKQPYGRRKNVREHVGDVEEFFQCFVMVLTCPVFQRLPVITAVLEEGCWLC